MFGLKCCLSLLEKLGTMSLSTLTPLLAHCELEACFDSGSCQAFVLVQRKHLKSMLVQIILLEHPSESVCAHWKCTRHGPRLASCEQKLSITNTLDADLEL